MQLQNIDMKDYAATQNLILLTEIRKYQKQQIIEKKKEFIYTVIINGVVIASLICGLLIFDSFFETHIRFKKPDSDYAEISSDKKVGRLNEIRERQNKKQGVASWQI